RDVFLRIKDAADLPALERGQLKQILVAPGDSIQPGQLLAELDDAEAKLNLELATIEFDIAEKQYRESADVPIATANLAEAQQLLSQARLEAEAIKTMASTDIGIRQATKDTEVSEGDLQRALSARKEFSSSVSEQQLVRLTLVRDHDLLKLEKAKLDQTVDLLRSQSREAIVAQQKAALERLEHALQKAVHEHETAALHLKGLEKQVAIARERVGRRKLTAPFAGVVVERLRSPGEWAEVGESVLRIIRMDVLFVEGYVSAHLINQESRGRKVVVGCGESNSVQRIEGTVVFVSPEVDPVSQQVLVRAEIRNPDSHFRPGQPAQMWIMP
ncbi:MAG: HlyD family efflux transporter periplasmic adaptor subunit, partial [Planctomycetaceae bacterium]|nr:HlyD family efflux transporter periplasmic adaptor subunit [Planctomycetaceae bacterium]